MTKLGKYVIGRSLGKGAMGTVFEAFDPVIQRTVAIKTVLPSQLGSTADAAAVLTRFKREAQAAGRLNHPGIVAVYDYGEEAAQHDAAMVSEPSAQQLEGQRVAFIAMEYVAGRELKTSFDTGQRFPLDEIARIMCDILSALEHAHQKGVTHRDIKPANLIMLADGRVKVADFGIARIETSDLTQIGEVMGTPSYMSPEQFQGRTVDNRSDIFSCGVILYQFLTGTKPFVGNTTTIMYKVLGEDPLAPSVLNGALPPEWDRLVGMAMAKNPDHRYQSAAAFAQAIRETAARQSPERVDMNQTLAVNLPLGPSEAPAADKTTTAATTPPAAHGVVHPAAPSPAPTRSGMTGLLTGGVVALVLLLGVAGAYLFQQEEKPADAATAIPATTTGPHTTAPATTPPLQQPGEQDKTPAPAAAADSAAPASTAAATTPATPASFAAPAAPVAAQGPVGSKDPRGPAVAKPAAPQTAPDKTARPVQPAPTLVRPSQRPERCALILQKAAMSEPLSADERNFLGSSCQ